MHGVRRDHMGWGNSERNMNEEVDMKNKKLFPGRRITHRGVGIGRPGGASIEHLKVLN